MQKRLLVVFESMLILFAKMNKNWYLNLQR